MKFIENPAVQFVLSVIGVGAAFGTAVGIPKLIQTKHVEKVNRQRMELIDRMMQNGKNAAEAVEAAKQNCKQGVDVE